jgi:hypothetical protein
MGSVEFKLTLKAPEVEVSQAATKKMLVLSSLALFLFRSSPSWSQTNVNTLSQIIQVCNRSASVKLASESDLSADDTPPHGKLRGHACLT